MESIFRRKGDLVMRTLAKRASEIRPVWRHLIRQLRQRDLDWDDPMPSGGVSGGFSAEGAKGR